MPGPQDDRYYAPPTRASQMGRYVGGSGLPTLTTASSFGNVATVPGRYYGGMNPGGAPSALLQFPNGAQAYANFKGRYPNGTTAAATYPNRPGVTVTPNVPPPSEAYLPPNDTYYGNTPRFTPPGATAPRTKSWRDVGHERVDQKLGAGWVERFSNAHGMSPLDFYTDERNWFGYQRDAAKDYGIDSPQFKDATVRATIQEGLMHQDEAAQWQQLHGNTPIPQEMWERWYYANRGGVDDNTGLMRDGLPVVY